MLWLNPNLTKMNEIHSMDLNKEDMIQAEEFWQKSAAFFRKEFSEVRETNGIIESPLRKINNLKESLDKQFDVKINGNLYLKCDNELPIAGSIKARGGFYEVLYYAVSLAKKAGLINEKTEDYGVLSTSTCKELFKNYHIGVGSTGNLGLSIGIMSAKLGFQVSVYMSRDAKQWKKDLLREKGATVLEFDGDFSQAVAIGRQQMLEKPNGYFVDDESSKHLFLGYSTAAFRLKKQLEEKNIIVNQEHPLFVYLPCGVGGAPGGITFGLKQVFGDHVHCFYTEPVKSPSHLLGLLTGKKDCISVQDFGIDNITDADGLAVGRPSKFASHFSEKMVSGIYTLEDRTLYELLTLLADTEEMHVEPSATGGLVGAYQVEKSKYMEKMNVKMATHIAWSTGGGLVPKEEMKGFYERGRMYLGSGK